MSGKILQVFLNVDLRNGHDGLTDIAKENGIKTREIDMGSYVVFVNTRKTKLKLFAAGNVVAYLKLPQGDHIDMRVIRELPRVFNGSRINYTDALKIAVERAMGNKVKAMQSVF